ncbi:MAG: DUF6702 family protein, partial [Bacteroidota bacterium]|nr:DUF6702 family protein [Bacteroidota bacterium]
YFNKNLEIKLNNNKSIENLTFIDFKSNFEATWFNFKIALSDKNINKIEIKNLILTDLYKNQNNLVIIKNNNTEKGYHLNVTDNIIKLSLK